MLIHCEFVAYSVAFVPPNVLDGGWSTYQSVSVCRGAVSNHTAVRHHVRER